MQYSEFEHMLRTSPTMVRPGDFLAKTDNKIVEERLHPRATWNANATIKELASDSNFPTLNVQGEVVNLSRGGACITSNVPLVPACVVQCEISMPGIGIPIPTLMQVVWVESTDDDKYFWGLRYVV